MSGAPKLVIRYRLLRMQLSATLWCNIVVGIAVAVAVDHVWRVSELGMNYAPGAASCPRPGCPGPGVCGVLCEVCVGFLRHRALPSGAGVNWPPQGVCGASGMPQEY